MGFSLQYGQNGCWFGKFSSFPDEIVTHAVSTKFGGVSKAPCRSLNLAMHTGDNLEDVRENRRRFCHAVGWNAAEIVTAQQVHGDAVLRVDREYAGRGAMEYVDAIADTDALITDCPDLPLMLFFADCVPVLIVDPIRRTVGICHAGWKGTVAKIAQKTVDAMMREFGTHPADCFAGIGPSIGPCCYEVGSDVAAQFAGAFGETATTLARSHGDRWKLDLWAANRVQLEEIGMQKERIEISGICTSCNSDVFFSYRADHGHTGRIAAAIALCSEVK